MATTGLDRSRFIRILQLTNSANDSEALSAVRRANALLNAAGLSWDRLVVVPPATDTEPQTIEDREDPLWADASILVPSDWPASPMMPAGDLNAGGQVRAWLRSAASWLRLALSPAWKAAAAFAAACIDKSRLHEAVGRLRRFVRALGKRAPAADETSEDDRPAAGRREPAGRAAGGRKVDPRR
jgi:hypothetical protein